MSSPHWKAKLRYVRGQEKRASTLWRCFRCAWCSRLRRPKALSNCFCKHALGNPNRGYQVPLVIICAYGMTQSCAGIKYTTACNQAVSPTEEKDVLLLLLSQATQREVLLGLCWPCSDKIGSNDEVAPHCVSTRIFFNMPLKWTAWKYCLACNCPECCKSQFVWTNLSSTPFPFVYDHVRNV